MKEGLTFTASGWHSKEPEKKRAGHKHKGSLLMEHTSRPGDVADPWYTGEFEATWQDVPEGCTALPEELR